MPLVVVGDSAGGHRGHRATVTAAEIAGTVPLAPQVLIYPVADRDLGTAGGGAIVATSSTAGLRGAQPMRRASTSRSGS